MCLAINDKALKPGSVGCALQNPCLKTVSSRCDSSCVTGCCADYPFPTIDGSAFLLMALEFCRLPLLTLPMTIKCCLPVVLFLFSFMFLFKTQEKMHQTTLITKVTKSFTAPNLQLYIVSGVLNSQLWVLGSTRVLWKDALLQLVMCLFPAVDDVFP